MDKKNLRMIRAYLRNIQEDWVNDSVRKNIENKDFSLLSNNCVGGFISHRLGLQFKSPTVNLWFKDSDYIKFLKSIRDYLKMDLVETQSGRPYPVGMLGDITIYFQHYHSFDEARNKWYERTKRINWDNLYVIYITLATARNDVIDNVLALDYDNIAVLSCVEHPKDNRIHYISKAVGREESTLGGLCNYISKFSGKRYFDEFDYVNWLNRK